MVSRNGDAGRELWEGLIRPKEEAFTRDIGVSNYRIEEILELIEATGEDASSLDMIPSWRVGPKVGRRGRRLDCDLARH